MSAHWDRALRAFRAKDVHECERSARAHLALAPNDSAAWQLLGIALQELGRTDEALAALLRSTELAPRNAEYRANVGLLFAKTQRFAAAIEQFEQALALDKRLRTAALSLARVANQAERFALAERHARALTEQNPSDAAAWSALGQALVGLGRYAQARRAFERTLARDPTYSGAHARLATVLNQLELPHEALQVAAAAARAGIVDRHLVLGRARALLQLDDYTQAEACLAEYLQAVPDDRDAHFLLAQSRHVRGAPDVTATIRAAAHRAGASLEMRLLEADMLRRLGSLPEAEAALRSLLPEHAQHSAVAAALAVILNESNRASDALPFARQALAAEPERLECAETFVVTALSAGLAAEAVPVIERWRVLRPRDQRWITYRADAARQLDDPLFVEWCDPARWVAIFDLGPPPGFASLAAFHADLAAVLNERHRGTQHPLDQSMRRGTQTSRGLLAEDHEVVRAFLHATAAPLADYQARIGHDPSHPFTARNRSPATIAGCWSVKLRRGGYHVNHIHPEGWISSAYYVVVPEEAADPERRTGWLQFGEPLVAQPGGRPIFQVAPRPGRLVLFPSYLWHGTTTLDSDEPRLTIAFDAVPSGETAN